ncbi:hypothetical protein HPP92_011473 [Vanilla planifolia]|uniref:Terpene synthase metal-binding domain-containing protein n=1 Tax=Vanilla planifolia TaxID=51239 RepID=A0A835R2X4_VANPL|nr:hypothetical protein HPP92_011473 [Vanilla planifolia]
MALKHILHRGMRKRKPLSKVRHQEHAPQLKRAAGFRALKRSAMWSFSTLLVQGTLYPSVSTRNYYQGREYISRRRELIEDVRSLIRQPRGVIQQLELFDTLHQIGVAYHFEMEIKDLLSSMWSELCNAYLVELRWYYEGSTPTLDEYLENALVSISGVCSLTAAYCLSENLSTDALDTYEFFPSVARSSSLIFRLYNDLATSTDSSKNRDFLGEFWDKLSGDEAKELVSLKCVNLEDIIQASPSVFPVTSHELFSVLDDASENTLLCAGTALSVQKYVFDGEAVKSALEIQNLVAFTSFLEKELVKAWLADKDAEALRCQKLLVEEEEAAQKRQADLLEAKRLKKLRLKGQKTKDTSNIMDAEFKSVPIESTSKTFTNQQQQILDHSGLSIGNEEIKLRLSLHENCGEKSRSFIALSANENLSPHGVTGETSPKWVFPSEEAVQYMVCKTQRENDHQQQYSLRHAYLQARNLGSAFWDHQTSSVYKRHLDQKKLGLKMSNGCSASFPSYASSRQASESSDFLSIFNDPT